MPAREAPTTKPPPPTTSADGVSITDFANAWCAAPWLWTGQQSAAGCAAKHHDAPDQ